LYGINGCGIIERKRMMNMPRAKPDHTQAHFLEMIDIANLKSYSTDLLFDFSVIYPIRLKKCGEWLMDDDFESLKKIIEKLSKFHVKPMIKSRVYIVTEDIHVCFAMYNMDECVIDQLEYIYGQCGISYPEDYCPSFLATLYIFRDNQLTFSTDISVNQLVKIMAVFHKENLVNYSGARDDLYAKPRRAAHHQD
jgi:hypothetical protein